MLVLVVEDAFDLYDLVGTVLALDPDVTTARARDGGQALEMARTMRPDLVVLDIRPPGLGGLKVARQLKADPATRAIPRVALSSDPPSKSVLRVCDHYVTRPYDLTTLVERLRESAAARRKPDVAA